MKIEIVNLSKSKNAGVETFEATFKVDGSLQPLRVSNDERQETFNKVANLIQTPNPDMDELGVKLYELMSPIANVRKSIESDFYLSENMSIVNGVIHFGEHTLEETLSDHILSLLDDDNTPKDGRLWRSYVTFLDNLHQNVNEDIRKQLFRWMDYENKAGNGFGITEDGCIVGYKGCVGTVLQPMSQFTGTAIVDGVEINGSIPNKVGSVIQMPRSAVQFDPQVGCSVGLHVGTRDYAVNWAPILLLVKVNPRDIVSVPYEADSQKMRVCEYTVLEVTDASDEHRRFYPSEEDLEDLEDEVDFGSEQFTAAEDLVLDLDTAYDLQDENIYVEYDDGDKTFEGVLSEVFDDGFKPGIIIRNEDDEYKHIKLKRISFYSADFDDVDEDEEEFVEGRAYEWEEIKGVFERLIGSEVVVTYDDEEKVAEGVVTSIYDNPENPGIIISTDDGVKHIKLRRIKELQYEEEVVEEVEETEIVNGAKMQEFLEDLEDLIKNALD